MQNLISEVLICDKWNITSILINLSRKRKFINSVLDDSYNTGVIHNSAYLDQIKLI